MITKAQFLRGLESFLDTLIDLGKLPIALVFVIGIYICAAFLWFGEHCINLCTGKGWTGTSFL